MKNIKILVATVIIILLIIAIAFVEISHSQKSLATKFSSFKASYLSSNHINIYANATSLKNFSYTMGCATDIIELAIANRTVHKNPGDINLFMMNSTGCAYADGLLSVGNYSNINSTDCLSYSNKYPSVFINEKPYNKTIVNGNKLYIDGQPTFLKECGISEDLT